MQKERLREKVKMRTMELAQTNEELKTINEELERSRKKSDELLFNILPQETAKELKQNGQYLPKNYEMASVLFTDFKGFTSIAASLSPSRLLSELEYFFNAFDAIVEANGLEKIKTIGDSYMCAGGIPKENKTNPIRAVLAGLQIARFVELDTINREREGKPTWQVRIGINTGELVAGIIGQKRVIYDVWGDTVNMASRMESSGTIGCVNISAPTYEQVKDYFHCEGRGEVFVKGKGKVEMFTVSKLKEEYSLNGTGHDPNENYKTALLLLDGGQQYTTSK